MPLWLTLAESSLAYFALAILLLGLLRHILLTLWDFVRAYRHAGDQSYLPVWQLVWKSIQWLLPTGHLRKAKPWFVFASLAFHLGILISALFLVNHLDILRTLVGVAWFPIFKPVLDWVTVVAILGGVTILFYRLSPRGARAISRGADFSLLLLFLGIFVSGFVAGRPWNPIPYDQLMLFHTLCGFAIVVLIPFTKITHCVLFPLSRIGTELAWRLTPHGGEDVARTLDGSEERKI